MAFSLRYPSMPWAPENSVQTRCIVKGEAQKNPLFWRFFLEVFDFLRTACSLGILEAQWRYFSYRAMPAAIVSQSFFVLVFVGYRTIIARICCKMGYRIDVPVRN